MPRSAKPGCLPDAWRAVNRLPAAPQDGFACRSLPLPPGPGRRSVPRRGRAGTEAWVSRQGAARAEAQRAQSSGGDASCAWLDRLGCQRRPGPKPAFPGYVCGPTGSAPRWLFAAALSRPGPSNASRRHKKVRAGADGPGRARCAAGGKAAELGVSDQDTGPIEIAAAQPRASLSPLRPLAPLPT